MKQRKLKAEKLLFIEFSKGLVNLFLGNAFNKIELSLVLLIPGFGFIYIAKTQELSHPAILFIIGSLFIIISLSIILKRYKELKQLLKNEIIDHNKKS